MNKIGRFAFIVIAVLAFLPACATTHQYLSSDLSQPVEMKDSSFHRFEYVRSYMEDGRLVVYGKVDHRHVACNPEGHVDLAIKKQDGSVVYATSLPMVNRGQRRTGWRGAHFRAKLDVVPPEDSRLSLVFHNDTCNMGQPYDCGENRAE